MSQTLYIPHPHIIRLHDVYGTVYIMYLDIASPYSKRLYDTCRCVARMSHYIPQVHKSYVCIVPCCMFTVCCSACASCSHRLR